MKNILRVFTRDIKRLLRAPSALVVIIALAILPSLYTWINVYGFWNPYNNTGNLRVMVVNEDLGTEDDTIGKLDLGAQVSESLAENDQLGWEFADRETSMDELNAGRAYAVFVMPSDFSANVATILSGDFTAPTIEYYVNEKAGPVSTKITDAGATALDETINSTFVSTVSKVVAEAFDQALNDSKEQTEETCDKVTSKIDDADAAVSSSRAAIGQIYAECQDAKTAAQNARTQLDQAYDDIEALSAALQNVSELATKAEEELGDFVTDSWPLIDSATKDQLTDEIIPQLSKALTSIAVATGNLSGVVMNQQQLVSQTDVLLEQLSVVLESTCTALAQTDTMLASTQGDLSELRTDIVSLSSSNAVTQLLEQTNVTPTQLASFMQSPAVITTEKLYPLTAYGCAMTPLFGNLTLWIGVFMLMVIILQEVDSVGIPGLTAAQRYLGRMLTLSIIAAAQGIVLVAGCLALGVQTASVPIFFITAVITALAYLSVQYFLSTSLQHVGKGICIILVFAQIPGASGLYPIEMTPPFFQNIYPLLPFTYGINAMREAIAGFYGLQWLQCMGVLLACFVVSLLLGLFVRPLLININRMVAKRVQQSDLICCEEVMSEPHRFPLKQLVQSVLDHDEFRQSVLNSALVFEHLYPRLMKGIVGGALGVVVVLTAVLGVLGFEKVQILSMWLICFLIVILAVLIIENMRDNFEQQTQLSEMSDHEVRDLFAERKQGGEQNA